MEGMGWEEWECVAAAATLSYLAGKETREREREREKERECAEGPTESKLKFGVY